MGRWVGGWLLCRCGLECGAERGVWLSWGVVTGLLVMVVLSRTDLLEGTCTDNKVEGLDGV